MDLCEAVGRLGSAGVRSAISTTGSGARRAAMSEPGRRLMGCHLRYSGMVPGVLAVCTRSAQ